MPHSASAKKRHRQSEGRRVKNRAVRNTLKTQVKKVREAVAAGNVETSEAEFRAAAKKLDRAAAKGVIHANVAGRVKSRLSAAVKGVKQKKK